MRNILRRAKGISVVLVRELIPAPTIGRFQKLRAFSRNPVRTGGRKLGAIASRRLSPKNYCRLRSFYFKYIKSKLPSQVPLQNANSRVNLPNPVARLGSKAISLDDNTFFYKAETFQGIEEFQASNGQLKCDIVIACAFYGRYDILDLVIEEGTAENPQADVLFCLVGSTDEDRSFLEEVTRKNPRVFGIIAENRPVGRKWQTAVHAAHQICDFEILGITGSDDILATSLLSKVLQRHRENIANTGTGHLLPALYSTLEWLIFAKGPKQAYTPQLVKCNYKLDSAIMPLGAGRFYSRTFVDEVDGVLFDIKRDKLLDDQGFELVNKMGKGVEYFEESDGSVISVKGNWVQMNEFDAIATAPTVDVREYSFEGYTLLKDQLSSPVFEKLFNAPDAKKIL